VSLKFLSFFLDLSTDFDVMVEEPGTIESLTLIKVNNHDAYGCTSLELPHKHHRLNRL
jgi:hypothetical protein